MSESYFIFTSLSFNSLDIAAVNFLLCMGATRFSLSQTIGSAFLDDLLDGNYCGTSVIFMKLISSPTGFRLNRWPKTHFRVSISFRRTSFSLAELDHLALSLALEFYHLVYFQIS